MFVFFVYSFLIILRQVSWWWCQFHLLPWQIPRSCKMMLNKKCVSSLPNFYWRYKACLFNVSYFLGGPSADCLGITFGAVDLHSAQSIRHRWGEFDVVLFFKLFFILEVFKSCAYFCSLFCGSYSLAWSALRRQVSLHTEFFFTLWRDYSFFSNVLSRWAGLPSGIGHCRSCVSCYLLYPLWVFRNSVACLFHLSNLRVNVITFARKK